MAIPLQTQLFSAFLGQSQGINSIALPDVFSSGGCKNFSIDKYARAKVIDGFAKKNAAAITSNGGSTAVLFRGIVPYRTTIGASISRQVLAFVDDGANYWEMWKSTNDGGTYSFVFQGGSSSVGFIPDAAEFGDTLYFVNGVLAPRKYDGTSVTTAGRTQSPTPTATASSTPGLLNGNYTYKLVSVQAAGARKAGSVASNTLTRVSNQTTLSWTADGDGATVGYEVYRTTGTGVRFYFVSYVDGRTTTSFTDNVADQTILENRLMAEHGDPPPTGVYFVEPHKQRLWYGRTNANPTRVWYSDPALPEDVYTNNYIDFTDSETVGDILTGMLGNFIGMLVVFTEKTIWTVSGTGNQFGAIVDWNRKRSNAGTGACTHRCVTRIPAGAKYVDSHGNIATTDAESLAYLTPFGDIRLFDGQNDSIISFPVQDTLSTFNYGARDKAWVLNDPVRNEITFFYPDGSSGVPNKALTWNYTWGVWYPRDWTTFAHGATMDTSASAQQLLVGANATSIGGYSYQLWSGNSFDGSNIPAQWMTKTLWGHPLEDASGPPIMSLRKRWRWVDLLLKAVQTQTFTIEWMPGNVEDGAAATGSQVVSTAAGHILSANGSRVVTLTGSPLAVGAASTQVKVLLHDSSGRYLHHEGIRLRISSNNQNGAWALESMNLAYQVLPGQARRFQ